MGRYGKKYPLCVLQSDGHSVLSRHFRNRALYHIKEEEQFLNVKYDHLRKNTLQYACEILHYCLGESEYLGDCFDCPTKDGLPDVPP